MKKFKINTIKIQDKNIGENSPPFIIAELSGNHNQSLNQALKIIDSAAEVGADAIKLQTYTADTITLPIRNNSFVVKDKKSLWSGKNLYELYQKAHTPWDWHKPLMKRAKEKGLICFSSPFDEKAVDFLEDLSVPAYKIASFELNHFPLIKKVSKTGKPIIMSTGMASVSEISEAVELAKESGCKDLILLKCNSTYPAKSSDINLNTIPHMRELFKCNIGFSDHTLGIGSSIAAVSLGASVIEKHFTISRGDGGVDSAFSLEPHEFKNLVSECHQAWLSIGKVYYGPSETEKKSLIFRRSIYVSKNIKKGEKISQNNIKIIRPSDGLHPKFYDSIIGKKVKKDLKMGDPLNWDLLN